MYLAALDYSKDNDKKNIILFVISENDSHYFGLRSNLISDDSVKWLKKNYDNIKNLEVSRRSHIMKANIPNYNKAFRRVRKDRCEVIGIYQL